MTRTTPGVIQQIRTECRFDVRAADRCVIEMAQFMVERGLVSVEPPAAVLDQCQQAISVCAGLDPTTAFPWAFAYVLGYHGLLGPADTAEAGSWRAWQEKKLGREIRLPVRYGCGYEAAVIDGIVRRWPVGRLGDALTVAALNGTIRVAYGTKAARSARRLPTGSPAPAPGTDRSRAYADPWLTDLAAAVVL